MNIVKRKYASPFLIMFLMITLRSYAGPPFTTDDPAPVPFKHWEFYISSIDNFQNHEWSGTSPHFEVNYGLIRNMQVHLLVPINYLSVQHQDTKFGYADTEVGVKYCFLQETKSRPQIGTFPIFELPTIKNSDFSNGKTKIFIPLWAQKSWNKLTTYGGTGYLINPGTGNKNSVFTGWEVQYDFSPAISLGEEVYFQTADAVNGKNVTAFNIGGSINPSGKMHFIFSFGHSITNQNFFSSYLGVLWTI